jgi:hypothetical protein
LLTEASSFAEHAIPLEMLRLRRIIHFLPLTAYSLRYSTGRWYFFFFSSCATLWRFDTRKIKDHTDKNLSYVPGNNIICLSKKPDSTASIQTKEFMISELEIGNVKSRAKQIPQEAVKHCLTTIPLFYQHQSTVFTDLGKSKVCNLSEEKTW